MTTEIERGGAKGLEGGTGDMEDACCGHPAGRRGVEGLLLLHLGSVGRTRRCGCGARGRFGGCGRRTGRHRDSEEQLPDSVQEREHLSMVKIQWSCAMASPRWNVDSVDIHDRSVSS